MARSLQSKSASSNRTGGRSPLISSFGSKSWPIEQLPGLGEAEQRSLQNCGITTTLELLQRTHQVAGREAIAAQLRLHPQHLTKWIALADLARIPAVGCQYCGLLLHAGIASPRQLAQTSLPRLHRQILKLHVAMMQTKEHCPSLEEVAEWLRQARHL